MHVCTLRQFWSKSRKETNWILNIKKSNIPTIEWQRTVHLVNKVWIIRWSIISVQSKLNKSVFSFPGRKVCISWRDIRDDLTGVVSVTCKHHCLDVGDSFGPVDWSRSTNSIGGYTATQYKYEVSRSSAVASVCGGKLQLVVIFLSFITTCKMFS